jgi:response regulator RpfG family c-di-GMP phosphodiesterase
MTVVNEDIMTTINGTGMDVNKTTSDILDNIWRKIGSDKKTNSLISGMTQMTRRALNASVSLLFFVDEETQELVLKYAGGQILRQIRRFPIDSKSGLTGWVARSGKHAVMNNVVNNPRVNRFAYKVYGFTPKSLICAPVIVHRKVVGVIEIANRAGQADFTRNDVHTLIGVAATAAQVIENIRLNDCLRGYYKSTIDALVSLADAKETAGCGHSKRVAEYALIGARRLGLSEEYRHSIEYAAVLHDIGKLAIPDSILNKPGNLTDNEREIMNKHPEIGYNLIREIPFLEDASWLILYHHERFDGTGYPRQLKGRAIPLGARLISVADAFDNMTTEHAYRAALDYKTAFVELGRHGRSQFCPMAVRAFFSGFLESKSSDKR